MDERNIRVHTPYDQTFSAIFFLGCVVAAVPSFLAGCMPRSSWCSLLLSTGVLIFWATLVIASVMGYRAWQSMPDAPREAFNDASASGALLFGWLPGGIFCLTVFGFALGARWLLHWANPDVYPPVTKPVSPTTKTGKRVHNAHGR